MTCLGSKAFTPKILGLARWLAGYCCSVEHALRSVLPEAVRKEEAGWKERAVRSCALPLGTSVPELTPRQQSVWNIIEEWRELPLQELCSSGGNHAGHGPQTGGQGIRGDRPAAKSGIPTRTNDSCPLNRWYRTPNSRRPLASIRQAIGPSGSLPEPGTTPPEFFLLHGVTGSARLRSISRTLAHALEQGRGIVLVPEIS